MCISLLDLKQFRISKINYNACTHFASLWGRESYKHACLVFTLNFESRALLNILRCRFAFHFGGFFMQGRFFIKMSEESHRLKKGVSVSVFVTVASRKLEYPQTEL